MMREVELLTSKGGNGKRSFRRGGVTSTGGKRNLWRKKKGRSRAEEVGVRPGAEGGVKIVFSKEWVVLPQKRGGGGGSGRSFCYVKGTRNHQERGEMPERKIGKKVGEV